MDGRGSQARGSRVSEMADERDDDGPDGQVWGGQQWGGGGFLPYGAAWRGAALALEDALVEPEVLDRLVPLNVRWAEPSSVCSH